jgi:cytoskeletal protein CcmA (bactofilin family)
MFNSRRSEPSAPSTHIISSEDSESRDHLMMAPSHTSSGMKDLNAHHTIVDELLTMRGDLESAGDILVQGKVFGNIKCKLLIIDTAALVDGGIDAEDVFIRGKSKGTIMADRVRLERTADVDSDMCQIVFSAEEGARVRGTLKMKQAQASTEKKAATSANDKKPGVAPSDKEAAVSKTH